jgi:hypothetical protein
MNSAALLKYAAAVMTLAICSACGGGSAVSPSTAAANIRYIGRALSVNGRLVTAARVGAPLRYATIVPARHARHKDFEYVINFYGSYASIFDYPKSDAQIGTINNVGGQGCTNVLYGYGKKIFWIVAAYNNITEYKVRQTPIKTLSTPSSYGMPTSCAMDAGGNLAVGIFYGTGGGDVVIFKNASGAGTFYTTPLIAEYFDGYDPHGNLFADGYTSSSFGLVELPKGSSKAQTITTSNAVGFPGSVQWDGTYLTVFDQYADSTYQYAVKGTTATLKGTVHYTGVGDCAQTWIVKGLLYCGDSINGGEVFRYPAGGSPVASFTGNFVSPLGVTVSERR